MAYNHKKMMPNMSSYGNGENPGYRPPSGSAGAAARGVYSHKSNPLSVPMKGSQISAVSEYGNNADRRKMMSLKDEEARKESLRGQAG